jgi:hypothetical protein
MKYIIIDIDRLTVEFAYEEPSDPGLSGSGYRAQVSKEGEKAKAWEAEVEAKSREVRAAAAAAPRVG